MGNTCCFEGLAALVSVNHGQSEVMLPAASFVQTGSRFALSHREECAQRRLFETYEVSTDCLGEGSFGTVVKTTSKATGSACVLKKIDKRGVPREVLASLANEIAIHEVCDHPSIVRMFESFESESHIHIALEACEGGEVCELLEKRGRLCEAEALPIMQQVLQAVLYLHVVKNVAHRDLKLENLLLKRRGVPLAENTVKVIDFGLSASFTPGERSFTCVCGSPNYMAPEIVAGPYDEKCDIWSCGIMLFELLTDDLPFDADTVPKLLHLAATQPLPLHRRELRKGSREVRVLLRGLCDKDFTERPSAEEALLSPCFEGSTPHSRASSPEREALAENLRGFSSLDDFQKVALQIAAYRLDDQDIAEQRTAFRMLDKNGDGRLTPEELDEGCPEIGLSSEEARTLFHSLDVDGSGCLEYSEFIGAAVCKDRLPHHACWEAFRFCDRDGSGSITGAEVRELLQCQVSTGKRDAKSPLGGEELDFDTFAAMLRGGKVGGA